MSPSSTWLKAIDSTAKRPLLTVTITLAGVGGNPARTLRFSDVPWIDNLGKPYDPVLVDQPNIDQRGSFMSTDIDLCDFDLVVRDYRAPFQAVGERLSHLFHLYNWVGSQCVVKQWERGLALTDIVTIFNGTIADISTAKVGEVRLHIVQDRIAWDVPLPPKQIERTKFEWASKDVIGWPEPIFLGNFSAPYWKLAGLPSPCNKNKWLAGIARNGIPCIPVDPGTGGNAPRFLVSGDSWTIMSGSTGNEVMVAESGLGRLMGTTYVLSAEDTGGPAYLDLNHSDWNKWEVAIIPDFVLSPYPGVTYPFELLREDKDDLLTGATQVAYVAGNGYISLRLPDVASLGQFIGATLYCWFAKNASSAPHPTLQSYNPISSGLDTYTFAAGASSTYPSTTPKDCVTLAMTNSVTGWGDLKNTQVSVSCLATGQGVYVHRLVAVVQFVPARNIVTLSKGVKNPYSGRAEIVTQTVESFDVPVSTYQTGPYDDAYGSFTGTPSSLIEHPVSMIYYLLITYAGLDWTDISVGTDFGSLEAAITALSGYKAAVYCAEKRKLRDVIKDICDQFLLRPFKSTFQNTYCILPWDVDPAVDYRSTSAVFKFTREYVKALEVGMTPVTDVYNSVRVNYSYDWKNNTFGQQVYISVDQAGATGSRGWSGSAETRDQNTTAPNNRETLAAASKTAYGLREKIHNMKYCNDSATATAVRNRLFDLRSVSRPMVRFLTGMNAADLERGRIIELGADHDAYKPYPKRGSDGSWAGKPLVVTGVNRLATRPITYVVQAVGVDK